MRFYHLPMDHVLFDLPSHQGWSLYAWSEQNNGAIEMDFVSPGYLSQESMKYEV